MAGDVNLPKMDINKYEQYVNKSLDAGVGDKTGVAKAQQVLSNMSHNLQAFVKQVHTYFNERTQSGDRKWVNNERVVKSLNKKFDKLEKNQPGDSKVAFADVQQSIKEARDLLKSMKQAGIPEAEINQLNRKLDVLDKATSKERLADIKEGKHAVRAEKEREKGLQMVPSAGSEVVDHTEKRSKDNLEGRGFRREKNVKENDMQIVPFEGSKVVDHTEKRSKDNLEGRGVKRELNLKRGNVNEEEGFNAGDWEVDEEFFKEPSKAVGGQKGSKTDDDLELGRKAKDARKGALTAEDTAGVKVRDNFRTEAAERKQRAEVAETTGKHHKEMRLRADIDGLLKDLIGAVLKNEDFVSGLTEHGTIFAPLSEDTNELALLKEFKTVANEKDMQEVKNTASQIVEIIISNYENSNIVASPKILQSIKRLQDKLS